MFKQISSWWQDRRIGWAYRPYRAKLLELHQAEAEVRYPVTQKRADIDAVQKQARRSAAELFGNQLGSIERKLSQTRATAKERSRQLALLQEDIEPKISTTMRCYEEKRQKLSKLLEEKNAAEGELNDAKAAVSSWHEDTKDWLGNRYPDIPQSSFFGRMRIPMKRATRTGLKWATAPTRSGPPIPIRSGPQRRCQLGSLGTIC